MTTTVIGLFGDTEEAKKAARAIKGTGHAKQEPQVMDAGAKGVGDELTGRGFDEETASRYARAVARGPVLVLARVEGDRADAVAEVITPRARCPWRRPRRPAANRAASRRGPPSQSSRRRSRSASRASPKAPSASRAT
jgi:hypothetical protein